MSNNRAARRAAGLRGPGGQPLPPGLDLSGLNLGQMPEQPALGEQRRSAAIQLAIQSGIHFGEPEELIDAAAAIESYLINGELPDVDADGDAGDPPDEPTDAGIFGLPDSDE